MSRTHHFFNQFRLGDCLWTCHWLRKVALKYPEEKFVFYCKHEHHWQASPLLENCPNAELRDLVQTPAGAINTWINAHNEFPPPHSNLTRFLTDIFDRVAAMAGLESPIKTRQDWLFDYPGIANSRLGEKPEFGWLVVDSDPQSGQFRFDRGAMNLLKLRLRREHKVISTKEALGDGYGWSITDFGALSMRAENILMIATGPCWTTFNAVTESRLKNRIMLEGTPMILNYGREWPHFTNLPDAVKYMEGNGLI